VLLRVFGVDRELFSLVGSPSVARVRTTRLVVLTILFSLLVQYVIEAWRLLTYTQYGGYIGHEAQENHPSVEATTKQTAPSLQG
jgi:hypothetical protein